MAPDTSDLRIAVAQPRTWARRLTITVPAERVRRERDDVARRLARRVKLPGFRQGKIPQAVVERQFGPAIDREALERVVGDAYREALARHQFQPISQGEVENIDYTPGSDLTFDVEFEIRPVIELSRLGGFRITRERPEVTDEDVNRVLERVREQNAVWHPVEAEAPVDGDAVTVEITPAAAAKPRHYHLVLGKGEAVPSVEAAIRTLKPGEERDFTLELPDPEAGEGATREERTRIRLVEAHRPELPALDDEFARSVGDFDDLATLRARIREDLEREADAEAERGVRHRLLDAIIEANPFELPDSLVYQYLQRLIPAQEGADPTGLAEAREVARPAAMRVLRRMMVLERVAELEGLRATSADLDARVEALAERQGRPAGEVWAQLQKTGRLSRLEEEITEDKVFEYLESQSTIE